jgi:hypothetical protein
VETTESIQDSGGFEDNKLTLLGFDLEGEGDDEVIEEVLEIDPGKSGKMAIHFRTKQLYTQIPTPSVAMMLGFLANAAVLAEQDKDIAPETGKMMLDRPMECDDLQWMVAYGDIASKRVVMFEVAMRVDAKDTEGVFARIFFPVNSLITALNSLFRKGSMRAILETRKLVEKAYEFHDRHQHTEAARVIEDAIDLGKRKDAPVEVLKVLETLAAEFGRAAERCKETRLPAPPVFHIHDLISDDERQIQRDAEAGTPLALDVSLLLEELVTIAKKDKFLCAHKKRGFDECRRNARAREIGFALHEKGGMPLMQALFYRLAIRVPQQARSLEVCWGYIGEWLP